MHLSDHDLKQLDEEYLHSLPPERLRGLSSKLLSDLKEAHDRLNQNPSNSSRPPSSRAPWEKSEGASREDSADEENSEDDDADLAPEVPAAPEGNGKEAQTGEKDEEGPAPKAAEAQTKAPSRPGKRKGAPGHGRTQQLPVDAEQIHRPETCAACGAALDEDCEQHAYTARFEIDLVQPGNGDTGLILFQTKHIHLEVGCSCGHRTREPPGRCRSEAGWTVALTEAHLAGPMLATFICAMAQRMRLSRARIQEFLHDWLGLALSVATINQCIHEAGRAVAPVVEDEIRAAIREAEVLFADETSWKEGGQLLWLWVFVCTNATLFVVGKRARAMVLRVLGETFDNWLMTDGYSVYRDYLWRLRCLAHIVRKARGLEESLDREAGDFGKQVLKVMDTIMGAVYQARGSPSEGSLRSRYSALLDDLFKVCVDHAASAHAKTRALARELLYDWDTFWVTLDYPQLPLTNNLAERALRHWVIARRISQGTRTPQGTYAFSLLASIIETCRQRKVSPWPYLAEVLRQRRRDLPPPALPAPEQPATAA